MKAFLPEPVKVSFLNKHDCVVEFSADFGLQTIVVDLQQTSQWFGYDVMITCETVTKDKLNDIEQGKGGTQPAPPQFGYHRKKFKSPTVSAQQIERQVQKATQSITN